jgi:methionyl-tRNA synthetase
MTTSLITTAIPYVNARPHLGFAYELVLGDVLARHRRRRGHDVRFVTGTDDNSLKNVAAAARAGVPPRVLVERNVAAFARSRRCSTWYPTTSSRRRPTHATGSRSHGYGARAP